MLSPVMPDKEQQRESPRTPRRGYYKSPLFRRSDYFIEDQMDFRSGSQQRSGLRLALWSWMSAFIDTLILISISCFCIILFSFLMKTPARDVLKFISIEPNVEKMFAVFFLCSFWAYLVVMRIYMGASLGEWSCQLRLGQPAQRISEGYVLRVIARTTLILLTGVVVLPLLSMLFRRDLVGDLTGLRIYSLT